MAALEDDIDQLADETGFSGVIRVDNEQGLVLAKAYGMAHRALQVPNTVDTQFGLASAVKGMTAIAVVSLVVDGILELSTPARSVLGSDLPLIGDDVTIEHLLSHRSGIGDYLDEDAGYDIADYMMPVPVSQLATTEQFLTVLDGHQTKFPAGEQFSYCNGGFVVLALIAERVSGVPFHDLIDDRVCMPAGMVDTAFLRSDELPGRAALGYLTVDGAVRTNLLHLPVRGNGDGGIYSTVADIRSFWLAFCDGRLVHSEWVTEMVRPRSVISDRERYGLGFWLQGAGEGTGDALRLEGYDAGVSFRSWHHPARRLTHTVISNTSDDQGAAWPLTKLLYERLSTAAPD
ncbi:MAG TPA: serine hydrolase domain-containing protein [Ilumatobacteraceae bacterium]